MRCDSCTLLCNGFLRDLDQYLLSLIEQVRYCRLITIATRLATSISTLFTWLALFTWRTWFSWLTSISAVSLVAMARSGLGRGLDFQNLRWRFNRLDWFYIRVPLIEGSRLGFRLPG